MSTQHEWEALAVRGGANTPQEMERIIKRYIRENEWFGEYDTTENSDKIFDEFKRTKLPFSTLTFDEVVRSLVERGELRKVSDVPVESGIAIAATDGRTIREKQFTTGATTLTVGSIDDPLSDPSIEVPQELRNWVRDVYHKTTAYDAKRLIHTDPDFRTLYEASAAVGLI